MKQVRIFWYFTFVCGAILCILFYVDQNTFLLSQWKPLFSYRTKWVEKENFEKVGVIRRSSINQNQSFTEIRSDFINKTKNRFFDLHFTEDCFLKSNYSFESSSEDKDFEFLQTEEGKQYKTILVYHHAFSKDVGLGYGPNGFKAACCKEWRCFMTWKRDKIPIQDFDALWFHFRNIDHVKLPEVRKETQRWIFYERESPVHSTRNLESYNGIFNWTMTYRMDSDIYAGYGKIYPKTMFPNNTVTNYGRQIPITSSMKTKTKMAVWMASNCVTSSMREYFVKELKLHIDIDVYGKCGWLKCNETEICYKLFEEKYKFYFAFENSLCNDYMTEKFFNILRYNIVPVVIGSGDYESIAPHHSYIDIRNYGSIESLAEYLLYLDLNDAAYMEYFRWKSDYLVTPRLLSALEGFCELCEKLHTNSRKKTYYNLRDWFVEKASCIKYNQ